MMRRVLTTESGDTLSRLGVAGVQRALMDPVSPCGVVPKEYAMVWCEESEVYITRYGKDPKTCIFVVTYWDTEDISCPPQEQEFDNNRRKAAIELFLQLVKRDPLYEENVCA